MVSFNWYYLLVLKLLLVINCRKGIFKRHTYVLVCFNILRILLTMLLKDHFLGNLSQLSVKLDYISRLLFWALILAKMIIYFSQRGIRTRDWGKVRCWDVFIGPWCSSFGKFWHISLIFWLLISSFHTQSHLSWFSSSLKRSSCWTLFLYIVFRYPWVECFNILLFESNGLTLFD